MRTPRLRFQRLPRALKSISASLPILPILPILCLAAVVWPSPASAQNVPFKLMVTELWQLDENIDRGIGWIGDFYAVITINGREQHNKIACRDSTSGGIIVPFRLFKYGDKISQCGAETPWQFTEQVPRGQPVRVRIQVFDSDEFFDDEMDLKPGDGNAIDLTIDPATGQWSGDINYPQLCTRPNLAHGGNNVNLCFQASIDTDDDGLLDVWETSGVDTDNDGVSDLNLPLFGTHPLRKDLLVEIDHLEATTHTHAPMSQAIELIVRSFANAPIVNPDGTTGVQLHVDVGGIYGAGADFDVFGDLGTRGSFGDYGGGNAIAEAGNEILKPFNAPGQRTGVDPLALKKANFADGRDMFFRYALFGHQTSLRVDVNDCTSGLAHIVTNKEFLITLGGLRPGGLRPGGSRACWEVDAGGHSVGSLARQASTFMHELGHTLGLDHGGADAINGKLNYLSIMNYAFDPCEVPNVPGLLPGFCDYSRRVNGILPLTLNELSLDECAGIGGGLPFGAVDWNDNGLYEGASACTVNANNVRADANLDGICVTAGPDGILDTRAAPGDEVLPDEGEDTIKDGGDRVCNTTRAVNSDDVQVTPAGQTPTQPDELRSFDDWGNVAISLPRPGVGIGSGSGVTEDEADPDMIDEARRAVGGTMAPRVVVESTGPVTAKPGDQVTFTLNVSNTGRGPALSTVVEQRLPDGTLATADLGIIAAGTTVTHRTSSFTVPATACPGDLTAGSTSTVAFKNFIGQDLRFAATAPLRIVDAAAPAIELELSPRIIWPPLHQLVRVRATIVTRDTCDPRPQVTLVSITSSDDEPGPGRTFPIFNRPDIQGAAFGTDDREFFLRAERDGGRGRTGRVYTVTYRVTDASGNATLKTATVTVPHSILDIIFDRH
jgi:uncharacterized repeat protein (TIGR01451 family)